MDADVVPWDAGLNDADLGKPCHHRAEFLIVERE